MPDADPFPAQLSPMRAVSGELPPDDGTWAFEIKWDGVRALGTVRGGELRLQSSNGIDITGRYPELAPLGRELAAHEVVLDGEVVTFNAEGRPDFGLLQQRMHVHDARAVADWAARQPVVWVLFDVLHVDGTSLFVDPERPGDDDRARRASFTYERRHALLEQLVDDGPNWQVPVPVRHDGAELLRAVRLRGMEGLMAKRLDSPYEPGRRTTAWRKVKIRRRQELVVGGWKAGEGNREGSLGSLLVGHYDDGALRYAGAVGSGLTGSEIRRLEGVLGRLTRPDSPFRPPPTGAEARGVTWVEPEIVVEVAFGEWSHDGRLRHPSYVGQREDKDPRSVIREPEG
jgi:bifunctional non-homologous end joining protein LigD